jgi:hypothetical protein
MITFLRRAWRLHREEQAKLRRKQELANIAKTFNDRHTYRALEGRWMCPSCNAIHAQDGYSYFTGRLFPACCEYSSGDRLFLNIKTS